MLHMDILFNNIFIWDSVLYITRRRRGRRPTCILRRIFGNMQKLGKKVLSTVSTGGCAPHRMLHESSLRNRWLWEDDELTSADSGL